MRLLEILLQHKKCFKKNVAGFSTILSDEDFNAHIAASLGLIMLIDLSTCSRGSIGNLASSMHRVKRPRTETQLVPDCIQIRGAPMIYSRRVHQNLAFIYAIFSSSVNSNITYYQYTLWRRCCGCLAAPVSQCLHNNIATRHTFTKVSTQNGECVPERHTCHNTIDRKSVSEQCTSSAPL